MTRPTAAVTAPTTAPTTAPRRVPQLDVLRTVAIVLVIGRHPVVDWSGPQTAFPPALAWYEVGYTGVDLFFVLSGFLVSGLLFAEHARTGGIDWRRFLVRRAFKIWPTYYLYLAILALIVWRAGISPTRLLPLLVHLQNYFFDLSLSPHTWSLAVEEHFYLLLPAFLAFTMRRRPGVVPIVVGALAIGCATVRAVQHAPVPALLTHQRIDSLAIGVGVAWLYHLRPVWFARIAAFRWTLGVGGAALVVASVAGAGFGPVTDALVATGLAVGYAGILIVTVTTPVAAVPSAPVRLLAWLGSHSYATYLMHVDMGYRLTGVAFQVAGLRLIDPSAGLWLAASVVYVGLSFFAGVLVSRGIELPALALRDRLFPSRVGALDGR